MPISVGDRVGPYEILAQIGAGGMGEVWKARDTRLDRVVALKFSQNQFSERFEREAQAVAALNHSNICTLYDVGPNYLVMEFIDGAPVKGPLSIEGAVQYAGQMLDALDAAHRKGITHRDLKPANILVTRQGIKLLDFGLARMAPGPGDPTLTIAGAVLGTPAYMSPEQWDGKIADARSDIYSFGCVLCEMLTGKRVAQDLSGVDLCPAALRRVVRTCLEKDPDDRFQTARDVKKALTWALEQQPTSATKPSRRQAAGMLALGAAGGWAVSHFLRQPPINDRVLRLQIDAPEGGQFIFGNSIGGLTLSPDGKTAAYVAFVNGKTGLWIRALDSAAAWRVPGTEGTSPAYPFWHPDGRSVGYFTPTKLLTVDLSGGAPLTICKASTGRGGAWLNDGRIIFGSLAAGLFQVPESGGTPQPLTTVDKSNEEAHRWPQGIPGGHFMYLAYGNTQRIYAAPLDKPNGRVKLIETSSSAVYGAGSDGKGYLLWTRGGTLVAQDFDAGSLKLSGEPRQVVDVVSQMGLIRQLNASASTNGMLLYSASSTMSQFVWVDRKGTTLKTVGIPGEYSFFRLSPKGDRVMVSRDEPVGTDLWLMDAEHGFASHYTANNSINTYPLWAPNGQTIVFTSGGSRNLFRKDINGGEEQSITQSANPDYAGDWSRDGRYILYHEVAQATLRDLLYLPVTGDGKPAGEPVAYLRTQFSEQTGRFSPEMSPHWLAYQSDDSGRAEVYIQAFPKPGARFPISTAGGQYPQWGPSGRELFYVSPENKLMVVDLTITADTVTPSTPRELFALPSAEAGCSPYEVSLDGLTFLIRAVPKQAAQPLTVVENWPTLLKQQGK